MRAFLHLHIASHFTTFNHHKSRNILLIMKKKHVILILLAAAAVGIRLGFFSYETDDYLNFLSRWVEFFRQNGGFAALKYSVGNYNIPYLYFLAAFSYLNINDLYLIKALSCLFDFLLAFAGAKIVYECSGKKNAALGCFFAVLFLPTVVINSSLWGQCDSIYVSLALLGIYFALKNRPCLSMVFMSLSFGFKLQAVFLLPVCLLLLIMRKYRWYHFFIFPGAYFLQILPAVLIGRPIKDAVMLYFDQLGTVGSAPNYNAPSLNALTGGEGSVIAAFAAMAVIILLAFILRKRLSLSSFLILSCLMVTVIPFLLPHMHDRYFFAADVFCLVLLFSSLRDAVPLVSACLCQQFASLICYLAYLTGHYLRFGNGWLLNSKGSAAILIALAVYLIMFVLEITKAPPAKR